MACRTVLRSVFVTEPWRPLQRNGNFRSVKALRSFAISAPKRGSCGCYGAVVRARDIHFWKRTRKLNCSHNETPSSWASEEEEEVDQGPPQEAVLKAISEVSKTEGRVGQTTNVVIGGTVADDSTNEWLALDQKVNSYPTVRGFTAIGTGGDDFVQAMVVAVESVIQQPIPEISYQGRVRRKLSSRGKYVSVNIGPVRVVSSEQVQAVYNAMRRDDRMKYFLLLNLCCASVHGYGTRTIGIMARNIEESHEESKDMAEGELDQSILLSMPNSPSQNGRPSSMVIKKAQSVIPAHLVAEAISTLQGLDLRWSGPITPSEMQYVQQYVFAKYPQYCNGLVEDREKIEVDNLSINEESSEITIDDKRKPPRIVGNSTGGLSDLDNTQLEPSRLLDILTRKTSFQGNFISIPEIQAQNRALKHCGLSEDDYLVLFMPNHKDAMVLIGESYAFFKGNYYLTIITEESDSIREFATMRESKVISAPETWLDLRIKGSQLSQNFRRKCKHSPKGLFSYPAHVNGTRYSMHWISEAHRNSWHVLLDATGLVFGEERLALALHRPDFVMCTLDNTHTQPSKMTCLLVRKRSFDTT